MQNINEEKYISELILIETNVKNKDITEYSISENLGSIEKSYNMIISYSVSFDSIYFLLSSLKKELENTTRTT